MIALLASPLETAFEQFGKRVRNSCIICSPFISSGPVHRLVSVFSKEGRADSLDMTVVTDVSVRTIVDGATDVAALAYLAGRIPHATIRYLPRIHAKVYVADESYAIVTSANFTDGGALRNFEYGVSVDDPHIVSQIAADIRGYANLGGLLTRQRLDQLQDWAVRLRRAVEAERQAINDTLRRTFVELETEAELELLRSRVDGRTVNAIFSDTILYLLTRHPRKTEDIHARIQVIHPDLCDDTTDRVIDGQHFGKLWKHQVRTAQQHLKQAGAIQRDPNTGLWSRVP